MNKAQLSQEIIDDIKKGIATYKHEQEVILRLLRFRKGFTDADFDRWYQGREFHRRVPLRGGGITGDSFILGMGINGGTLWAEMLDLIHMMMRIGLVDCQKVGERYHYTLGANEKLRGAP